MTGYGQGSADLGETKVTAEVRTVNNRYADLRMRVPPEIAGHEAALRRRILTRVRRGRIELTIKVEGQGGAEPRPALNRGLLKEAVDSVAVLRDEFKLQGDLDLATALSLPGMLRAECSPVAWDDERRAALDRAVDLALESLDGERIREGKNLQGDLLERVDLMRASIERLRERAKRAPVDLRKRLLDRLAVLTDEIKLDPSRVEQEATVLADRCDVTEEIVRLEGHLEQARSLLAEPDGKPLGKRLDFLLQEIFRETNTINSKSSDLDLTRDCLELKSEADKVREQVQNLE